MTGRPSSYTEKAAAVICERLADGESLRSICSDADMPDKSTVLRWLDQNTSFRDQYARAREAQADHLFDEMLEIADDGARDTKVISSDGYEREVCDHEWISRSKLRVDTRKWQASKLAPKKYGDKLTTELTGADGAPLVDETAMAARLAAILETARERKGG